MAIHKTKLWAAFACSMIAMAGCTGQKSMNLSKHPHKPGPYRKVALEIEFPDAKVPIKQQAIATLPPRKLSDADNVVHRDISLEESTTIALQHSQVLRDLGGRVVTNPAAAATIYEPAIRESDPRFGVEAALSAFDAQLNSSMFWARNDRAINNTFFGGGTRVVIQETANFNAELSKTAATGTRYAIRNVTSYDGNNAPGNTFPSAYDTAFEAEFSHPLLQGGGIAFNRIAGPSANPGFFFSNGVLIARINTDISLADFEVGVRNLVSDVENAYWELYFAYRDLQAKIAARDSALETWRRVYALFQSGRAGGEAEKEAQAREQYFLFKAQVENALAGLPGRGTISGQGSTGGVFQGTGGVYAAERRLRFLMGLPANDGALLRPSDEPAAAEVVFDWQETLLEALTRRVELRRQKWLVKRRELELVASKNFLLPRLDVVGLYRWRGFGDDLISIDREPGRFDNAFQNLTSGDFQEWQTGFQLNVPIGFRQGWAAVRYAQLQLSRERAVLQDQELQISHDLSSAITELDRTYTLTQTNLDRRIAAQQQLTSVEAAYEAETATLDLLLDAQRRLADADVAYFRSLVEFTLALKNVHLEKGTLLNYNGICLTEGPWPCGAQADARELATHFKKRKLDYLYEMKPWRSSAGRYDQKPLEHGTYSEIGPRPTPADPVPPADVEDLNVPPIPTGQRPSLTPTAKRPSASPADRTLSQNILRLPPVRPAATPTVQEQPVAEAPSRPAAEPQQPSVETTESNVASAPMEEAPEVKLIPEIRPVSHEEPTENWDMPPLPEDFSSNNRKAPEAKAAPAPAVQMASPDSLRAIIR
ncbi:Cell division protein FtsK [Planctomycetales bacterium 10988]|nr:Cell division protein FtsK [Planctomycetales bacterium 10988]